MGKIKEFFEHRKLIKKNKELVKKFPFLQFPTFGSDKVSYDRTLFDSIPDGWKDLALEYFEKIRTVLIENKALDYLKIVEIKEKWGKLRIYYSFPNCPNYEKNKWMDTVDELFEKLEKDSWKCCIDCGKNAEYQTDGWVTPICVECKEKITKENPNVEIEKKNE